MNKVYYKARIRKVVNGGSAERIYPLDKNEAAIENTYARLLAEEIFKEEENKEAGKNENIRYCGIGKTLNIKIEVDRNLPFYIKYLKKSLNFFSRFQSTTEDQFIIFEKFVGEDEYLYAREIYTGLIFPIIKQGDIKDNYEAEIEAYREYKYGCLVYLTNYTMIIKYTMSFCNTSMPKVSSIILNDEVGVANTNEIEEYNSSFEKKGFFGKVKKNDSLINHLNILYKENTYSTEIIPKKEEIVEKEKQSPINKLMESIENLLYRLGKVNANLKKEKEEAYYKMLNSENSTLTTTPVNYETLKALEAELLFLLEFSKNNSEDIIVTLENILREYEENLCSSKTISDIDKLSLLFLKMKDNYTFKVQRKAITLLSTIYIYEVYENKESISIDNLRNSYFNEFINTISLVLNNMIDEGIIENNNIIDINNVTDEYILDVIINMKFVNSKKLELK